MDAPRGGHPDRRQRPGVGGQLHHGRGTGVPGELGVVRLVAAGHGLAGARAGDRVEVRGDQEVGPSLVGAVEEHRLVDNGGPGRDGRTGLLPGGLQRGQTALGAFDHRDGVGAEDADEVREPPPFVRVTVADQQFVRFTGRDRLAGGVVVQPYPGRVGVRQREPVPALERVDDVARRHHPPVLEPLHAPPHRPDPCSRDRPPGPWKAPWPSSSPRIPGCSARSPP